MIRLSIVIPVHNVRAYLRECLDSCLRQEADEFEIVCVDDGSTDGSSEILAEFARKDRRLKVVSLPESGGLFHARKCGVLNASGNYILHLDSDDRLKAGRGIRKLIDAAETRDVDMLVYGMWAFPDAPDDALAREQARGFNEHCGIADRDRIPYDDYLKMVYADHAVPHSVCGKLFRTSCLRDVYSAFPDGYCLMAEDAVFTLAFLGVPRTIASVSDRVYEYRIGTGVSTRCGSSFLRRKNILRSAAYVSQSIRQVPLCLANRFAETFRGETLALVMRQSVCGASRDELGELTAWGLPRFAPSDRFLLAAAVADEFDRRIPGVDALCGRLMLGGAFLGRLLCRMTGVRVGQVDQVRRHVRDMIRKGVSSP